jgi:hypothetical protein
MATEQVSDRSHPDPERAAEFSSDELREAAERVSSRTRFRILANGTAAFPAPERVEQPRVVVVARRFFRRGFAGLSSDE